MIFGADTNPLPFLDLFHNLADLFGLPLLVVLTLLSFR